MDQAILIAVFAFGIIGLAILLLYWTAKLEEVRELRRKLEREGKGR